MILSSSTQGFDHALTSVQAEFTSDESPNSDRITENWSEYVQSPNQLAFTRLTRFPPGSGSRLVDVLGIQSGEFILEVGSGLGILTSRLSETDEPFSITGCELNPSYLETKLPDPLQTNGQPPECRGDGFQLPFPDKSFNRVFTHAMATLIRGDDWTQLHRELRRVLKADGHVIHMDNIHNDGWTPKHLAVPQEEEARREQFNRIHRQVHRELETGYGHTARNLPERLRSIGARDIDIDSYSWVFDLNDSETWGRTQQTALLELWEDADRDRIIQFRRLLEEVDDSHVRWNNLLDQCLEDVNKQSNRRRESIEKSKGIGWRSCTTLSVSARF